MNDVLDEILRTKTVRDDQGRTYPVHSEVPVNSGEFLQRIIRDLRPKTSLEIGLAYAVSTLFICEALADVGADVHHVVDPLQTGEGRDRSFTYDPSDWDRYSWDPKTGWRGIGLLNLERAGFRDLVLHHDETSYLALPKLIRDGVKIDFAFIDGWHTFDYVLLDFFYIDLMLRPGGVIAFDDSTTPAVRKAIRYVLTNRSYSVIEEQRVRPRGSPGLKRRALAVATDTWDALSGAVAPEVATPDWMLGLPSTRCIALRKEADDALGDGSFGSRRWNDHHPF